jgi:hypothetical protein
MIIKRKVRKTRKKEFLPEIWRRINELGSLHLEAGLDHISDLTEKNKELDDDINNSNLPVMIADNFIRPYLPDGGKTVNVVFASRDNKENNEIWTVKKNDNNVIEFHINTIGLYRFYLSISGRRNESSPGTDFEIARRSSFYQELSKLPEPYFIFICVLSKISTMCHVFTTDKRGRRTVFQPDIKTNVEPYFPLLWALKQFEVFYKKVKNRDVRTDYEIIWHEGEWVNAHKQ